VTFEKDAETVREGLGFPHTGSCTCGDKYRAALSRMIEQHAELVKAVGAVLRYGPPALTELMECYRDHQHEPPEWWPVPTALENTLAALRTALSTEQGEDWGCRHSWNTCAECRAALSTEQGEGT